MMTPDSRDEAGASAVEYGLIVFAIAGLIAAIVFIFGGHVRDSFGDSCGRITSEFQGTPSSTC